MSVISHQYKLIFILVPGTGSTSTSQLLINEFDGQWLVEETIMNERNAVLVGKKHNTIEQLKMHEILDQQVINKYFKFATVRNHFDSLISVYLKRKFTYRHFISDKNSWIYYNNGYSAKDIQYCQDHTFEEWLNKHYGPKSWKEKWFKPAQKFLYKRKVNGVDRILKFENLESEFANMLKDLKIDTPYSFPKLNKTQNKKEEYAKHYTPSAVQIVSKAFREELELYDYAFET